MIGNDVVDLSDPESSRDARHGRFDRRVFAPGEFESLSIGNADVDPRWILWSAKEAAYKAARREDAGIVFSPTRFLVNLDRSLRGSVRSGTRRWPVRVRISGDCVHAVVGEEDSLTDTLSGTSRLAATELRDPSRGGRRFAIQSIAAWLGVAPSGLRIAQTNRVPELVVAGATAPLALSLSHHGRYVGFACRDSRPRIARRELPSSEDGGAAPVALAPSGDRTQPGFGSRSEARRSGLR